jgi:hypothetical protein
MRSNLGFSAGDKTSTQFCSPESYAQPLIGNGRRAVFWAAFGPGGRSKFWPRPSPRSVKSLWAGPDRDQFMGHFWLKDFKCFFVFLET